MYIEVISFCASMISYTTDFCIWYSDVNVYHKTETECMNKIDETIQNPLLAEEIVLRLYLNYNHIGEIDFTGYCIPMTELKSFFKDNGLEYKDIPEAL